ncbi:MAG: DNA-binding protein [Chitinophagaceae bacterium]|nr:DNA-binding protein [Chitinophagaceae bacterium]
MIVHRKYFQTTLLVLLISVTSISQPSRPPDPIEQNFLHPPSSAKPWVFWYWLHGAVSREGITADLGSMKKVGIAGAYLMPIKDTSSVIPFQPQVRQLTPEWWAMIKFALQEAKRLKLQIGIHVSDGFALAGGPWIMPEQSMQKLTWSKTFFRAGDRAEVILPLPEKKENYYKDIAVFAYPANYRNEIVLKNLKPVVTTSNGSDGSFLPEMGQRQTFRGDSSCWIQYTYPQQVTVRQVQIRKQNNPYQSQRFIIQKSDDGLFFTNVDTLQPPRHGWQDWDEPYTHAIRAFTTKYIRFLWNRDGTEPGGEDLDAAKWRPILRVQGIYLSEEPVINNYEAKNGSIWRVAANTTNEEVSNGDAVPSSRIINLTGKLAPDGKLNWVPPVNEDWVIVRIGHTSTGYTNATAGGGKGLECDKFSTEAVTYQFNNWFGKFYSQTDPAIAKEVIKIFHVDSWECGSQNWSRNFAFEFKKRRGYDLIPYLLVMTGTPVSDAVTSERILHDVRKTISELVNDKFYATLRNLAHAKGCSFSAESIAPTFVSDGLAHYKHADIPMGEFWLNSPTHDKPNDMLDAVSGGHIYGKKVIQAEAFTTLRSDWGEHPGSIKVLGDRAFATGINKLSLHVFMHNPWLDKKPGMTLDGIGLYYQRDQTWFRQSKAWIDYLTRCQALLQLGNPVTDIGVFIGEELPRRSILPDRLVKTLPELFWKEKLEAERKRLENAGQPMRTMPDGVTHTANMADPEDWIDAMNGYQYDCFNPDVLMQMKVVSGRVVTPGGASYSVLVVPGKHSMNPNAGMSMGVINKLRQLANAGARIIISEEYMKDLGSNKNVSIAPYTSGSFEKFGLRRDVEVRKGRSAIAWTHRMLGKADIYFISNQTNFEQPVELLFRIKDRKPEGWNPVNGNSFADFSWRMTDDGVLLFLRLLPSQSLFFSFSKKNTGDKQIILPVKYSNPIVLDRNWEVQFDKAYGGPISPVQFESLISWSHHTDSALRYYSGTAFYRKNFTIATEQKVSGAIIEFDSIYNMATVKVNGVDCGTVWTPPYSVDISRALKKGENKIEIEVANTWRNRLIGDELNVGKRITWFNSPYKLKEKPLLPAGIVGSVKLLIR